MNPSRILYFTHLPISLILWLSVIYNVQAQDSKIESIALENDSPRVEWLEMWPSAEEKHPSKSFRNRVNSLLFGIHQPELRTPVSILANNHEEFWVVDQGNMALFQVKNKVGDIPHSISKSGFDLSSLVGLCLGPDSSILFTDSHAGYIYVFMPGKKKLQILNKSLLLEQPTGIAYSTANKEIYVLETRAHRITILNEKGEIKKKIGTRGTAPGEFNYPTHI